MPFESSISACRWPGQSPCTSEGVLGSDSTPRASASRRAGSTVTTQERRPARAAASAKVADTVVLPTPPEPQHTTTERSATSSGSVVRRRAASSALARRPRPLAAGRRAHDAPSGTSAATASASASASTWVSRRPDGGRVERRHQQVGQGEVPAQALDLLGRDGVAGQPEVPGLLERGQVLRRHGQAGRVRHLGGRALEPDGLGVTGVDDDRAQLDARLVLQGVGRLDRLGDRQLLGQGDQDHPAAGGVAQQLDDVLGLGAQRPAPGRARPARWPRSGT